MSRGKERYMQACEECMKNVDQYIKDIDLLMENGSHGHAFSMAVIAGEEVAKAIGYILAWAMGDVKQAEERSEKWINTLHTNHEAKIAIQSMIGGAIETVEKTLKEIESEPHRFSILIKEAVKEAGPGKTKEEYVEIAMQKVFGEFVKHPVIKIHEISVERYESAKDVQKLKEKGLYVDIRGGKINTPFDIPKEDAIKQFKKLKEDYCQLGKIHEFFTSQSSQKISFVTTIALRALESWGL